MVNDEGISKPPAAVLHSFRATALKSRAIGFSKVSAAFLAPGFAGLSSGYPIFWWPSVVLVVVAVVLLLAWLPWLRNRLTPRRSLEPLGFQDYFAIYGRVGKELQQAQVRWNRSLTKTATATAGYAATLARFDPRTIGRSHSMRRIARDAVRHANRLEASLKSYEGASDRFFECIEGCVDGVGRQDEVLRVKVYDSLRPQVGSLRDKTRIMLRSCRELRKTLRGPMRGISQELNFASTRLDEVFGRAIDLGKRQATSCSALLTKMGRAGAS